MDNLGILNQVLCVDEFQIDKHKVYCAVIMAIVSQTRCKSFNAKLRATSEFSAIFRILVRSIPSNARITIVYKG
jgi:hypothetical protein